MQRILIAVLSLVHCTIFAHASAAPPPSGKEIPLFDGKALDGWEGDAQTWRVEEGAITGGSLEKKMPRNEFITTRRSFENFELRLKIRLQGDPATGMINSGIQIRSVRVPDHHEMSGYQADAGEGWWGKIYDESRRNKVVGDLLDAKAIAAAVRNGEWNDYIIRAEGPRIRTWINGVAACDYTEADGKIARDGLIALQVHSGGKVRVQFKDITIEEFPPTPGAPTWEKVGKPGEKKPQLRREDNPPSNAGPLSPHEQQKTFTLPEGLEMELVATEIPEMGIGKFVAVYFDQKGALWTMTALEYPVDGNENPAAAEALYKSKAKDKILVYDRDPQSPTGFVAKPRVFADGLAIPLGILPYKDGCYVQHGHALACCFRRLPGNSEHC